MQHALVPCSACRQWNPVLRRPFSAKPSRGAGKQQQIYGQCIRQGGMSGMARHSCQTERAPQRSAVPQQVLMLPVGRLVRIRQALDIDSMASTAPGQLPRAGMHLCGCRQRLQLQRQVGVAVADRRAGRAGRRRQQHHGAQPRQPAECRAMHTIPVNVWPRLRTACLHASSDYRPGMQAIAVCTLTLGVRGKGEPACDVQASA